MVPTQPPQTQFKHTPPTDDDILERVRVSLGSEPRIGLLEHPVRAGIDSGMLFLEGELPSIGAKKIALRRAAAVAGVAWVVDHLRVRPAERMTDAQIRDHVKDALFGEPALAQCALYVEDAGERRLIRAPENARGEMSVNVSDGVVTLEGELPSLGHKRLAGVLAWWVPGTRDVVDGLGVSPHEQDNDGEVTDAVRIALEKDPFVQATQVRVSSRDGVVTLQGWVPTKIEREMAEYDAWYVFGVGDVINEIETA